MSQPRSESSIVNFGITEAHARAHAAVFRDMLPAELWTVFDHTFLRSTALYEEFIYRLVLRVLRGIGLHTALRTTADARELTERAGLAPAQAVVPVDWMLRFLAAHGTLEVVEGETGRYQARAPLPTLDHTPVREEQRRYAPSWMPSYDLAESVAGEYPAFLRGEVSGEDVLFSARRLRLWIDYFSNDNGLYVVNNRVGAIAVEQWLPRARSRILELGGGLGSGALAVLERLHAMHRLEAIAEYRFTEFVGAFLRRGEQTLRTHYPSLTRFSFAPLDMNRPFGEQGAGPASVSVVYAVNTLHVAHDLQFTLGEARRVLEPGGRLIVSECIRPRPRQPLYPEFVFLLTETFRSPRLHPVHRPSGGFLTPEQWQAALEAAGFVDIRALPDVTRLRDRLPDFTVGAIGGTAPR